MSAYEPPNEIDPVFNSLAFQAPNSGTLTQEEADARYLARINTATSIATATSFSSEVAAPSWTSLNSSATNFHLDNLVGNAASLVIRNQNTLFDTFYRQAGTTKSHIFQTNGALTTNLTLSNALNTSGVPLSVTGNLTVTSTAATGLNGIQLEGAMFGRNDTTANTFNGTLSYTRHPIGWTISASKAVAIPTSNVTVDVIATGTPTTVFNTLSNGVWRFGVTCNNSAGLGSMTFAVMGYGAITGGTAINGTTGGAAGNLFHQTTAGLSNMGLSYPELIIRTTGNGTTGLVVNFTATYSVQPTITFNMWATKVA